MQRKEHSKFALPFLFVISIIGLALIPLLLSLSNLQPDVSPFRGIATSAIYSVICVGGITAVFYPGKCRLSFKKAINSKVSGSFAASVELKGHHPNCKKFSPNRITIKKTVFCSACTGLLIGAVISLVVTFLFALGLFNLGIESLWILAVGEILMLIGIFQIKMGSYTKLAVNALFVVGSCFVFVVADSLGQSFLVDSYVLGMIVLILCFRILLSEWNNRRTCKICHRCF